jgi:hypothetical protein
MPRTHWPIVLSMLVSATFASAATTTAPRKTQTIQAEVRTDPSSAWSGESSPTATTQPFADKFTRYATPAGQPQTFSGKVIGLPPNAPAQIGVVAMIGTQWIRTDNYKWQKLAPDGSFTITGDHKPDAGMVLAVDVRGRAQQFLSAEFDATESAGDIEFHLAKTKPIVITMEDATGREVAGFRAEVFTATHRTDERGNPVQMQRIGNVTAAGGAVVFETVADEPVAVLLAGPRVAPYYAVVDPRQADEFRFKMLAESRIRGLVTRDGKPASGAQVFLVNDAAPLSATIRKTDGQGRFDAPARTPGVHRIRINGHESMVQVQPGETAQVTIELGAATPTAPFVPVVPARSAGAR